jgi:hypothetical protein
MAKRVEGARGTTQRREELRSQLQNAEKDHADGLLSAEDLEEVRNHVRGAARRLNGLPQLAAAPLQAALPGAKRL